MADNYGDVSADTIPQFAQFIAAVGGTGMVTLDYGSGSPQEAAAELAYLEGSPSDTTVIGNGIEWNDSTSQWQTVNWETVGYWASLRAASPLATDDGLNFLRIDHPAPFTDIKYWEIGNEEYGSWEIDHHGTAGPGGVSTGAQHDPATYVAFAEQFASFAAIRPGGPAGDLIGIDSGDPTGAPTTTGRERPDRRAGHRLRARLHLRSQLHAGARRRERFVPAERHRFGPAAASWIGRRAMPTTNPCCSEIVGAKAASVQVMATEFNSVYTDPGKQMTSLVNGLFIADSIGSLLDSGYTGGFVWDLRNGWNTDRKQLASLYGWREGGDYGLLGIPSINDPPSTGAYVAYPSYFAEQLASKIVPERRRGRLGRQQLRRPRRLRGHGSQRPSRPAGDQHESRRQPHRANSIFTGFTPSGQAQVWQYGEAQDTPRARAQQRRGALANFTTDAEPERRKFQLRFPAYSMTVIDLTPMLDGRHRRRGDPNPVDRQIHRAERLGLENGSSSGLTYTWSATGPAPVTYTGNTNGTNAAKNITAIFTQAGSYKLHGEDRRFRRAVSPPVPVAVTVTGRAVVSNFQVNDGMRRTLDGRFATVTFNEPVTLMRAPRSRSTCYRKPAGLRRR